MTAAHKLWMTACITLLLGCLGMRSQRDEARAELAGFGEQVATAQAMAEAHARAQETQMRQDADKVNHETATRLQAATRSAADAHRTADSLRATLASLNAGQAPTEPEAAGHAEQARTARDLLGACSGRYASVAADADQLAIQVSGLQEFARLVCGAVSDVVESE
jgi:hypothetical protein